VRLVEPVGFGRDDGLCNRRVPRPASRGELPTQRDVVRERMLVRNGKG